MLALCNFLIQHPGLPATRFGRVLSCRVFFLNSIDKLRLLLCSYAAPFLDVVMSVC